MQELVEQIGAQDFRKSPRRNRSEHPYRLDVPRIVTQEFYVKTSEDVQVISAQSLSRRSRNQDIKQNSWAQPDRYRDCSLNNLMKSIKRDYRYRKTE